MGIIDLFSSPVLITLLIALLSLGFMFYYFNNRLALQESKLETISNVLSKELYLIRNQINVPSKEYSSEPKFEYASQLLSKSNDLIEVSDDDEEDIDEDDDDIDEEDSDYEDEEVYDDDLSDTLSLVDIINIEEDIKNDEEDDQMNLNIENIDMRKENINESNNVTLDNDISLDLDKSLEEVSKQENDIKEVFLNEKINLENVENIDNLEEETIGQHGKNEVEKLDFKKMPLNKLRDLVVSKGLVVDSSKLKKHELLKLLGDE